jgi:hypothetical protein
MGPGSREDGRSSGWLERLRASLPALAFRRRSSAARRSDAPRSSAPRTAFTREDARRLNARFSGLARPERRAIIRAVNRGEAMPKRRDAELAVGVARRQQRFWSRAWLLGPSIAIVQVLVIPTITWQEGVLLAVWGTLLLGMMAAWWWTRARRAELLNLATLGPRGLGGGARQSGRGDERSSGRETPRRSRLPGGRASVPDPTAGEVSGPDTPQEEGDRIVARPPRPRGRKRR